ncbi:MAG: hypothetical protein U0Z17_09110 [Bacteroidales bacterium]
MLLHSTEEQNYDQQFHSRYEHARLNWQAPQVCGLIESSKNKSIGDEMDETHAFYSLRGTENCISLTTTYYQQYPMVIKGPGAGINVTAAGVLADIVRIAKGLKQNMIINRKALT